MRRILLAVFLLLGGQHASFAVDLNFTGTLAGVCTLGLSSPGTLGLSPDGSRLSSEQGLAAVLTVVSVGTNKITVSPPVWAASPSGYLTNGETLEVSYSGLGGLASVNHSFTAASSEFTISTLPLTLVNVHARAHNLAGFAAGNYLMKVLVTCS